MKTITMSDEDWDSVLLLLKEKSHEFLFDSKIDREDEARSLNRIRLEIERQRKEHDEKG